MAVNVLLTLEQYLKMVDGPIEIDIGGGTTVKLAVDATWRDVATRYQPGYGDVDPGPDSPIKTYTVTLTSKGNNVVKVMQAIRSITDLNMIETKKLIDTIPSVIVDNVYAGKVEKIMNLIAKAGGEVHITEN